MAVGHNIVSELSFAEMLLLIVLGWILVVLWQRYIDNLVFVTLGLNKDSTYHTFVIAVTATIIFLVFLFTFDSYSAGLVEERIESGFDAPSDPDVIIPPNNLETNMLPKSII